MNNARNLVEMGDFYASTVLTEASKKYNKEEFGKDSFAKAGKKTSEVVTPKGLKTKAFNDRGPFSNENEKSLVKPLEAKNVKKGEKSFTGVEKLSLAPEKMEVEPINNFMNKSIFDRLYEEVINDGDSSESSEQHDALALDLPGTGEGDDEVTITLSRELAGKLHDALMSVLGSAEEQHAEDKGVGEDGEDAEEAYCSKDGNKLEGGKCPKCSGYAEATELEELNVPGSVAKGGQHPWTQTGAKDNQVKNSYTTHNVDGELGNAPVNNPVDASGKVLDGQIYGAGIKTDTTTVPKKPVPVDSKVSKNVGEVLFGASKGAYKGSNTAGAKIRDFRKA
jgi:hypothetical protein